MLPDLPDDGVNDRLEGIVAVPVQGRADAWMVFALKERTAAPGRVPVYFPGYLERRDGAWTLAPRGRRAAGETVDPWAPAALVAERDRIGAQADACLAPDGAVWVLDRWRREIHVAKAEPQGGGSPTLLCTGGYDYFDLVKDVPGEVEGQMPIKLPAPGTTRAGFGRHEALTFDREGWLYLAADLGGGGGGSPLVVLAPQAP